MVGMRRYQLREAIVAVSREADGHMRIFTLAAGSVVTVDGSTRESGLVDAVCRDQTIAVFLEDLRERADITEAVSGHATPGI